MNYDDQCRHEVMQSRHCHQSAVLYHMMSNLARRSRSQYQQTECAAALNT